jgi:hypothetical protein
MRSGAAIMSYPRRLPAAGSFDCDRFDDCWGNDPGVASLAPTTSCNASSARQKHFSAVTFMQCYNITFFLRLPLLGAKEQGASQGSCSPTPPRRSHKKSRGSFPSAERKAIAKKSSDLQPWPVKPPAPVIWQNRFEGIDGRNRRKQC